MNSGKILVNHSQLKDSIFLLNKGDILMKNMKSSNDIKASTKQGDIKYNFGENLKTHYSNYILVEVKKLLTISTLKKAK